jgi:hypothetical protein
LNLQNLLSYPPSMSCHFISKNISVLEKLPYLMLAFTFERRELFFTDGFFVYVCARLKLFSQCACVFVQPSNLLRRMVRLTAMIVWTLLLLIFCFSRSSFHTLLYYIYFCWSGCDCLTAVIFSG